MVGEVDGAELALHHKVLHVPVHKTHYLTRLVLIRPILFFSFLHNSILIIIVEYEKVRSFLDVAGCVDQEALKFGVPILDNRRCYQYTIRAKMPAVHRERRM